MKVAEETKERDASKKELPTAKAVTIARDSKEAKWAVVVTVGEYIDGTGSTGQPFHFAMRSAAETFLRQTLMRVCWHFIRVNYKRRETKDSLEKQAYVKAYGEGTLEAAENLARETSTWNQLPGDTRAHNPAELNWTLTEVTLSEEEPDDLPNSF